MMQKPYGDKVEYFALRTNIVDNEAPKLPANNGYSADFINFLELW